MRLQAIRIAAVVVLTLGSTAAIVCAQDTKEGGRFITGPLAWTPTLQIHDAGVDSNVFNDPFGPKQDVTASALSRVNSILTLGVLRATTLGSVEYNYFEKYATERGLNRRVATRVELPVSRFSPNLSASWGHVKERSGNEIDIRTPRTDLAYAAGIETSLTSRMSIIATGGRQKSTYASGFTFHDIDIARQLNHESMSATLTARLALTALTSLSIDATAFHDDFPFRPAAATDNGRIDGRLEFAPDAVIRGSASVGYHVMQPYYRRAANTVAGAFSGITSTVDLGYTMFGVTRFATHFSRDASYSLYTDQPYYLSTTGGLQILQKLFGPVDLDLHGTIERMDYPRTDAEPARLDTSDVAAGGLSIRVAPQSVISLVYENSERRSARGREFGYQRRRLYTTITYGF